MDRQGESYSIYFTTNRLDKRIDVHTWTDTNEVIIRLIKGDGRTADFKTYKTINLDNPTQEQIDEAVQQTIELASQL